MLAGNNLIVLPLNEQGPSNIVFGHCLSLVSHQRGLLPISVGLEITELMSWVTQSRESRGLASPSGHAII